jgi:hypothetical protein
VDDEKPFIPLVSTFFPCTRPSCVWELYTDFRSDNSAGLTIPWIEHICLVLFLLYVVNIFQLKELLNKRVLYLHGLNQLYADDVDILSQT